MIRLKIQNKICIVFILSLIASFKTFAEDASVKCIKLNKNKVCLSESIDFYDEPIYFLNINDKEYPLVSFSDKAELIKLNNISFKVRSGFLNKNYADIFTTFSLNKNSIIVDEVSIIVQINEPHFVAYEFCVVYLNMKFNENINFYIEKYFDLSRRNKHKDCNPKNNKKYKIEFINLSTP